LLFYIEIITLHMIEQILMGYLFLSNIELAAQF